MVSTAAPFPEYTSGHSVVSSAAAVVLTKLFGDNFSYTDSTEFEFGLPAGTFNSFENAASEAAISRFYGGIHYMPAITNGLEEGKKIGAFITGKVRTRRTGHTLRSIQMFKLCNARHLMKKHLLPNN